MDLPQFSAHSESNSKLVQLTMNEFLENIAQPACLIAPDATIRSMNSHLEALVGKKTGRKCHEVLAGIPSFCPFCPFDDLITGMRPELRDIRYTRRNEPQSINLKPVFDEGGVGLILESFRRLSSAGAPDENCQWAPPQLLNKLTGLLSISRGLLGAAAFKYKMEATLQTVIRSLGEESQPRVWLEIDGATYGEEYEDSQDSGRLYSHEIRVDGLTRGNLYVWWPIKEVIPPEEVYFLEETCDLIDRQLEINELWARLRKSEERYRKLANNLAKEMWSRTEALARETNYLEGILRCSEDMIITTDLDGRVVQFNVGAEKMLGYSSEEIQGSNINDLWVDPEERNRLMEDVFLSGGIRNYQTVLLTKSGEHKEISLTLSLLKDEDSRVIGTVGVSKDIGHENAMRRELERLNQNYREAIHFINHETKNSLIVMGGFLRRLVKTEANPGRLEQLKIVYHHSKFLEAMSRDFLVMAELEHGEFQTRKRHIKNVYDEVILPAMKGLKERYPDSFQSYDSSMGGVGAIEVNGDPALLEIVYRNLFGNALKYRFPGGRIAYGVRDLGDRYIFNVWNEGPGVPETEKEKIFEKFYRVQDESTRGKRGTGLGLFNIRNIIEAHNGKIWCETRPGEWINFLFELPKDTND